MELFEWAGDWKSPPIEHHRVSLDEREQATTLRCARERFVRRRKSGSKHGRGIVEESYTVETEVHALGAELAGARVLGLKWVDSDLPDYDGDLGYGNQIKHTLHAYGKLLLNVTDNPDHFYFLVTGIFPRYDMVGWIVGRDGQQQVFWGVIKPGRPACYGIPQAALRKVSEFKLLHPVHM